MKFTFSILTASALLLASCSRSQTVAEQPAANRNDAAAATVAAPHSCIDLNKASAEALMELPGIGEVMSRRIIEYRERHGPFRRAAEIIIVEGFSEKKYRAIADHICVEQVTSDK